MFQGHSDDGEEDADHPDDGEGDSGPGPGHVVVIAESMDDSQVLIHCYHECREERQTGYKVRHCLTYQALAWQGDRRHHQVHGHQGEEEQVGQQVHHQQVYDKAENKSSL